MKIFKDLLFSSIVFIIIAISFYFVFSIGASKVAPENWDVVNHISVVGAVIIAMIFDTHQLIIKMSKSKKD